MDLVTPPSAATVYEGTEVDFTGISWRARTLDGEYVDVTFSDLDSWSVYPPYYIDYLNPNYVAAAARGDVDDLAALGGYTLTYTVGGLTESYTYAWPNPVPLSRLHYTGRMSTRDYYSDDIPNFDGIVLDFEYSGAIRHQQRKPNRTYDHWRFNQIDEVYETAFIAIAVSTGEKPIIPNGPYDGIDPPDTKTGADWTGKFNIVYVPIDTITRIQGIELDNPKTFNFFIDDSLPYMWNATNHQADPVTGKDFDTTPSYIGRYYTDQGVSKPDGSGVVTSAARDTYRWEWKGLEPVQNRNGIASKLDSITDAARIATINKWKALVSESDSFTVSYSDGTKKSFVIRDALLNRHPIEFWSIDYPLNQGYFLDSKNEITEQTIFRYRGYPVKAPIKVYNKLDTIRIDVDPNPVVIDNNKANLVWIDNLEEEPGWVYSDITKYVTVTAIYLPLVGTDTAEKVVTYMADPVSPGFWGVTGWGKALVAKNNGKTTTLKVAYQMDRETSTTTYPVGYFTGGKWKSAKYGGTKKSGTIPVQIENFK